VDKVGRGILLVRDEAMTVEDMRTKLIALRTLQHNMDLDAVFEAKKEIDALADEANGSLDAKLRSLRWRHWALIPMWAFVIVFASALWIKYRRLKAAMVAPWSG
jgi:hypothetical protein